MVDNVEHVETLSVSNWNTQEWCSGSSRLDSPQSRVVDTHGTPALWQEARIKRGEGQQIQTSDENIKARIRYCDEALFGRSRCCLCRNILSLRLPVFLDLSPTLRPVKDDLSQTDGFGEISCRALMPIVGVANVADTADSLLSMSQ